MSNWLPITVKEIEKLGWSQADVILISGDAYVDHPAFGTAMIGRWIEYLGYKVAIIPQPNWRDDLRDFKKFGAPKLFFGVTSGNMDSMVNHYTAFKRLRSDDAYTPGGIAGFRPDYATEVYTKILKSLYPEVPVILGGVEASMRRLTHYDYWSDSLKPSILESSRADMLVYGMGEITIKNILEQLSKGHPINTLENILQTAIIKDKSKLENYSNYIFLPSHEACRKSKKEFAKSFILFETESHKLKPTGLIQQNGDHLIIINPPNPPSLESDMDLFYDLPFTRLPHPKYQKRGSIPAWDMIKNSITIHRGCFGGCSFCAISAHQGKFISSRSEQSILKELNTISNHSDFSGHITDLGGPSANMYKMKGQNLEICTKCKRASCLFPSVCKNLCTDHSPLIELYRKASAIKGIKKITIGSGIRYDLFINRPLQEDKPFKHFEYFETLIKNHVSGRLKVAPENTEEKVLKLMRKPNILLYEALNKQFIKINSKHNLNYQLIPYLISNYPGNCFDDTVNTALWLKNHNIKPEQIQDFTPTPMTNSTTAYYCGFDPYTNETINVLKDVTERKKNQTLFFYYKKENKSAITSILRKNNRADAIKKLFNY